MTRTAAREIAIHCAYSLGFSRQSAEELLQERLDRARFLQWGEEDPLYREYPNEKQLQYIQDVVRGVAEHGPELDQYIAQYAKNWNFARIPLPAAAIMRVAMYEILYRPDIPAAAHALVPGLFAAGDMRTGQSLVVRALADGRAAAREVHRWLGVAER